MPSMQIFVKMLQNTTITLNVTQLDSIASVKQQVYDRMATTGDNFDGLDDFNLVFGCKKLLPRKCVGDYQIRQESTLFVTRACVGGGKRARTQSNPFGTEIKQLISSADASPMATSLNETLTLLGTRLTCKQFFDTLDVSVLQRMRQFSTEGKHTHEVKLSMMVAMTPNLEALADIQNKVGNSRDELIVRYSKCLWDEVISRSEAKKFNMDILRMMLDDAIRQKSSEMEI